MEGMRQGKKEGDRDALPQKNRVEMRGECRARLAMTEKVSGTGFAALWARFLTYNLFEKLTINGGVR